MSRCAPALVLAFAIAAPALAAPPPSGGTASGKVSMQDMHFTKKTDAVAHCDKAPVTLAADGSYTCSMPFTDHAINTKGTGTDKEVVKKPQ